MSNSPSILYFLVFFMLLNCSFSNGPVGFNDAYDDFDKDSVYDQGDFDTANFDGSMVEPGSATFFSDQQNSFNTHGAGADAPSDQGVSALGKNFVYLQNPNEVPFTMMTNEQSISSLSGGTSSTFNAFKPVDTPDIALESFSKLDKPIQFALDTTNKLVDKAIVSSAGADITAKLVDRTTANCAKEEAASFSTQNEKEGDLVSRRNIDDGVAVDDINQQDASDDRQGIIDASTDIEARVQRQPYLSPTAQRIQAQDEAVQDAQDTIDHVSDVIKSMRGHAIEIIKDAGELEAHFLNCVNGKKIQVPSNGDIDKSACIYTTPSPPSGLCNSNPNTCPMKLTNGYVDDTSTVNNPNSVVPAVNNVGQDGGWEPVYLTRSRIFNRNAENPNNQNNTARNEANNNNQNNSINNHSNNNNNNGAFSQNSNQNMNSIPSSLSNNQNADNSSSTINANIQFNTKNVDNSSVNTNANNISSNTNNNNSNNGKNNGQINTNSNGKDLVVANNTNPSYIVSEWSAPIKTDNNETSINMTNVSSNDSAAYIAFVAQAQAAVKSWKEQIESCKKILDAAVAEAARNHLINNNINQEHLYNPFIVKPEASDLAALAPVSVPATVNVAPPQAVKLTPNTNYLPTNIKVIPVKEPQFQAIGNFKIVKSGTDKAIMPKNKKVRKVRKKKASYHNYNTYGTHW